MLKDKYKNYLKNIISENEEMVFDGDFNNCIYVIDEIVVSADMQNGIRGVEHASLSERDLRTKEQFFIDDKEIKHIITYEDLISWGTFVVPETKTYISDEINNNFENIGYKRLPITENNHFLETEKTQEQIFIEETAKKYVENMWKVSNFHFNEQEQKHFFDRDILTYHYDSDEFLEEAIEKFESDGSEFYLTEENKELFDTLISNYEKPQGYWLNESYIIHSKHLLNVDENNKLSSIFLDDKSIRELSQNYYKDYQSYLVENPADSDSELHQTLYLEKEDAINFIQTDLKNVLTNKNYTDRIFGYDKDDHCIFTAYSKNENSSADENDFKTETLLESTDALNKLKACEKIFIQTDYGQVVENLSTFQNRYMKSKEMNKNKDFQKNKKTVLEK